MLKSLKRFAAVLVALAMMTVGLGVYAEAPAVPTAQAVYARGNTLKSDVHIEIDQATVTGLLGMMMPSGGEAGAAEAQNQIIQLAIGAVNKLKATVLSSSSAASFVLGTDKGDLLDVQTMMGAEGGAVTTNLLPGIKLALPAEMVTSILESQAALAAPQVSEEMMKPYSEAFAKFFQEEVLAKATAETGTYDFEGIGSLTQKHSLPLTQGLFAKAMATFLDVFKQDTAAQAMLDNYLKSMNTATQMGEEAAEEPAVDMSVGIKMGQAESIKNSAELITSLEGAIAELNQKPEEVLGNQVLYTAEGSPAVYSETEFLADAKPVAQFAIGVNKTAEAQTVKATFTTNAPAMGATEQPATADWAALKAAALDGSNPGVVLVQFSADGKADGTNHVATFSLDARAQGMPIVIAGDTTTALTGDYTSAGKFSIAALSPTPLLTVHYAANEVKDAPAALAAADKTVMLAEDTPEDDQSALSEALQKALPELMQRLQTALPEEAPTLLMLLQGPPSTDAVTTNPS